MGEESQDRVEPTRRGGDEPQAKRVQRGGHDAGRAQASGFV